MAVDPNSHDPTDHESGSSSLMLRRMELGRDAALLSRGLALSRELGLKVIVQFAKRPAVPFQSCSN